MSDNRRLTRDVLATLSANRQRTALMMAGVAIGVAVLSAVIVVGQGARERVLGTVARHGLDMLMVRAGGEVQVFAPTADRGLSALFLEDAEAVRASVPNVSMVSAVQNQRGMNVIAGDRSVVTRGFGVDADWMAIRRWGVAEGEFISDADVASASRVVLLGAGVARQLFPDGNAVGNTVRVNNDPYAVKGVFIEMGTTAGGDDWDDRIVVPVSTSARRLFGRPSLEQIVIRVADPRRTSETAERVRELLRVRHNIGPGQPDDFFVREPEDVEGAALETTTTLTWMLIAIAGVALIAGGIVIMNLMLLSVTQRAHEIGIRRAAGARASDITRQFVIESVIVSLGGGVTGVVIGLVAAAILAAAGLATPAISWVPFAVAILACVAIGVAFGLHPARRAAALDPVVALRQRKL